MADVRSSRVRPRSRWRRLVHFDLERDLPVSIGSGEPTTIAEAYAYVESDRVCVRLMGLGDQKRAALRTGKCHACAGELTTDTSATVTRGYRKARQRPGLRVVGRLLDPAQAGDHAIHSGHKRALRTRICCRQHPCEPLHSLIDNGLCGIGATPRGKLETRNLTYRGWILCRECVDSDLGRAHAGDATMRGGVIVDTMRRSRAVRSPSARHAHEAAAPAPSCSTSATDSEPFGGLSALARLDHAIGNFACVLAWDGRCA